MGINIQTQIKGNYLLVKAYGIFSKDGLLKVVEKSLNMAIQENLKNLLLDGSELKGSPPTTFERFEIGRAFTAIQTSKKEIIKCAFVGKEPIVDSEKFGETVAVNRGGFLAVFTDISDAVKWLKE